LRRAAREGRESLLGALGEETPERAAVLHSHPLWLAQLWWDRLGVEHARALMAYDNEPGEVALRANTLVTDAGTLAAELARSSVAVRRDSELVEALVLDGPFDAHGSEQWRAGAFTAQSRAAMLVAHALAPQAGERVLDLCAAPGGKTTHLAALMAGTGEVVAVEHNARRAAELQATARRLHAGNVRVEVADAGRPRRERGHERFDRVLVDPPCSGLGTLQARADLRWRMVPEAIGRLARVQASILDAGADALRPGGVLVYSTCTISPTENEQVIARFLDSHADFSLDDLAGDSSEVGRLVVASAAATRERDAKRSAGLSGTLTTMPHRDRTAGFFVARLRRS
jgi:16S rRNA (cytosine967-C5)-methyltransferase